MSNRDQEDKILYVNVQRSAADDGDATWALHTGKRRFPSYPK